MAKTTSKRIALSKRKRPIEEAVAYAVGNGTRIDALAILAEGRHSPSEIARILDLPVKLVGNHIRELYECGCIEKAGTKRVGNVTQHFYMGLAIPYIDDETYREMSVKARREVISVLLQAVLAESMGSFRAGKMEADDDVYLLWDCLPLDTAGRRELADEMQAHYERVLKIGKANAARLEEAEESGTMTFVSLMAFERSRPGPPEKRYKTPFEDS